MQPCSVWSGLSQPAPSLHLPIIAPAPLLRMRGPHYCVFPKSEGLAWKLCMISQKSHKYITCVEEGHFMVVWVLQKCITYIRTYVCGLYVRSCMRGVLWGVCVGWCEVWGGVGWGGLWCSEMRCDAVWCEAWCQCFEACSIHRCSVHDLYTSSTSGSRAHTHHPPLARGLIHIHMLAARWAYHRTDPQGLGSKWSQHCSPPMTVYIWRLWTKNRGHIGGLHGWSSALGRRLWVQAPGRGSFTPVATFKLCSWRTWTSYTPACITLTDDLHSVEIHIFLESSLLAPLPQGTYVYHALYGAQVCG